MKRTLIWVTFFAVAMAYVEAAVVVYLRELYYPGGLSFPLGMMSGKMVLVEVGREAATIVMLLTLALIAGKKLKDKVAYFLLLFGIWDISYYIWLKVILDWPKSLLDWDILFLIPVPWLGPVLAPVLVSLALILAAVTVLWFEEGERPLQFSRGSWLLEILAGLIVLLSFVWNFGVILRSEIPTNFPWSIFLLGFILGISILAREVARHLK
ncbi:MAG: hypothetical protein QMD08_06795 [Actinomycetota bacterium]|nr:hypothetical protein [Actinomycetota bacterium]